MKLFRFELLKLIRSRSYQVLLMLPVFYLLLILAHFVWNVDQSVIEQKAIQYESRSYEIHDPYYHFSSQFLAGVYLLVFPVQTILAFAVNQRLDDKENGWILIKTMGITPASWHLQSWLASVTWLACSMFTATMTLMFLLPILPTILSTLDFSAFYPSYEMIAWISVWSFIMGVPLLILHHWISFLFNNPSLSVIAALGLMVITFTLFNGTPYFLLSSQTAEGLNLMAQKLVISADSSWIPTLNYTWQVVVPIAVITCSCIVHAVFKSR